MLLIGFVLWASCNTKTQNGQLSMFMQICRIMRETMYIHVLGIELEKGQNVSRHNNRDMPNIVISFAWDKVGYSFNL